MRWWTYQKERFPIVAHGPLILAFSACAVSYSALLREDLPNLGAFGVAFVTCLLFFLQLRIADEFKDAEEDARWRSYRPVPRGLVTLGELRLVFIASAIVQAALAWWWEPRLWWVLGIGWLYLSLMSVEFFAREWLKSRPVVYLLTHMGIMPLVDLFATACDWMPEQGMTPSGLLPFLVASFFNGLVIEIGRKLRQPEEEEEGVETYSKLWGRGCGVAVWILCHLMTAVFAVLAANSIGFVMPVVAVLVVGVFLSSLISWRFLISKLKGKWVETAAGIWTLGLYLILGVVPLLLRWKGL